MPNRETPSPIVEIPRIFTTSSMDIAMIAHSREAIQRSLRILNESDRLVSYPVRHSDAVQNWGAESPKK